MAVNPNGPFGFRYLGLVDGSPPNFGLYPGKILKTNTNKIFTGDVLQPASNNAGYFDVSAVTGGGAPIGGVAVGFSWQSSAVGHRTWQGWWPGNGDALADIDVMVALHPQAMFEVQALLGPITQASIGLNGNFDIGGGGNVNGPGGISSFSLTAIGSGSSLPFRIYGFEDNSNPLYVLPGYDTTQPYNRVRVIFNNLAIA